MLDDFLLRAWLAGLGIAIMAGPLGCFVIWRRMAFFGDTMAHSALLGIALALLLGVHLFAGVFAITLAVALSLFALQRRVRLSADVLLGILAHSSLALGLIALATMDGVRIDLMGFLFGDILAVSRTDLAIVYGGGAIVLLVLVLIWNDLLATTVSPDLARAERRNTDRAELAFMVLMAILIAAALKIVGVLLITSLLVIPAATARLLAATPERMAAYAALVGLLSVSGGLSGSLAWDTPSGPSIVAAALGLFLISLLAGSAILATRGRSGIVRPRN